MNIALERIEKYIRRSDIIVSGRAQMEKVLGAHLERCGNRALCLTREDRNQYASQAVGLERTPKRGAQVSLDVKNVWQLLQGEKRVNLYTWHRTAGKVMLCLEWVDRSSEDMLVHVMNAKGESLEASLAESNGFKLAVASAQVKLFFKPQTLFRGRYRVDLADLLSLFPNLEGFIQTDARMVARNYLGWLHENVEKLSVVALHQETGIGVSLFFPLMQEDGAEVHGSALVFNQQERKRLDFLADDHEARAFQDLFDAVDNSLEVDKGFCAELSARKETRDGCPGLIWRQEEIDLALETADQIEEAYKGSVLTA